MRTRTKRMLAVLDFVNEFLDEENEMTAHPLEDRVLVKLDKQMERTKGGVYLPDSAKRDQLESMRGEVLSVGPGRLIENGTRAPMQVKAGDIVMLSKYSGSDVIIEGETLRIVNETELLAVLK